MQVDDRISLKTINTRYNSIAYESDVCRFGSSDAVQLVEMHQILEVLTAGADAFVGTALSRNPGHELAPPAAIADFMADEALYGRMAWITRFTGALAGTSQSRLGTQHYNFHGMVVPSRQIFVSMVINGSLSTGLVTEIYFREVILSRQEADLLNITWGKYRR